jgi:hypothetical protein
MPLEEKPAKPLPYGYRPAGGRPYPVRDRDDWASVAKKFGVDIQKLIKFNFNTLDTKEINWYLRHLNPWGVTAPDSNVIYGDPQDDPNVVVRRPTQYPSETWRPGGP